MTGAPTVLLHNPSSQAIMDFIRNDTFDVFGTLMSPTKQRLKEFDYTDALFTVRF